jgi:hypothetical protein
MNFISEAVWFQRPSSRCVLFLAITTETSRNKALTQQTNERWTSQQALTGKLTATIGGQTNNLATTLPTILWCTPHGAYRETYTPYYTWRRMLYGQIWTLSQSDVVTWVRVANLSPGKLLNWSSLLHYRFDFLLVNKMLATSIRIT